jgi:hypothetical protein
VRAPRPETLRLCAELGIGFAASMLEPRGNLPGAIRWGVGSEKAAGHAGIDARVADRWRETLDEGLLSADLRGALERLELDSA